MPTEENAAMRIMRKLFLIRDDGSQICGWSNAAMENFRVGLVVKGFDVRKEIVREIVACLNRELERERAGSLSSDAPLDEKTFKQVQLVFGPNSTLYEAVTDLQEYREWYKGKAQTVQEFVNDELFRETILEDVGRSAEGFAKILEKQVKAIFPWAKPERFESCECITGMELCCPREES